MHGSRRLLNKHLQAQRCVEDPNDTHGVARILKLGAHSQQHVQPFCACYTAQSEQRFFILQAHKAPGARLGCEAHRVGLIGDGPHALHRLEAGGPGVKLEVCDDGALGQVVWADTVNAVRLWDRAQKAVSRTHECTIEMA